MRLEGTITYPAKKHAVAHFTDRKAENQRPRQAYGKPSAQRKHLGSRGPSLTSCLAVPSPEPGPRRGVLPAEPSCGCG